MEDLNKNQLILLALLVSFVTSIATGIATVSLLEQAPKEVTRVINRVVERTVETVTPETNIITKEETVIVREDDVITESIAVNDARLTRIYTEGGDFLALGAVAFGNEGVVITAPIGAQENVQVEVSGLGTFNGKAIPSQDSRVGFIQITDPLEDGLLDPIVFTTAEDLKLGQSVIAFSGTAQTTVSLGVIGQLQVTANESGQLSVLAFDTSVAREKLLPGSIVTNVFGETMALFDGQTYLPLSVLKAALEGVTIEN